MLPPVDQGQQINLIVNRPPESGEVEIDLVRVFHTMKTRLRIYAWVMVLCLAAGICAPLLLYQFSRTPLTVSSVVTLNYDVVQRDKDGEIISTDPVQDLTSPDGGELTIGAYHPTTFNVALYNNFDKSLTKSQLSSLLKSILDAYRAYFAQVYAFGLDTSATLFTLEDYDYPQQLQILEKRLTAMSDYALELYDLDPAFRLNGIGFNDISVRLNTLIDSNISRLNAELTINALTKDPARLLTQYQYEIRSLNNQLDKQTLELVKLDKLIASYEKNEIIYLRTTDALTKIDGNSSETYDRLMGRRKDVADGITEINYQIATYELLLSDLLSEDAAQPQTAADDDSETTAEPSTETVAVMSEEELAAAAAEAERVTSLRREQLEKSISALVADSDAVLADFKAMLQAYSGEKINDLTVTVTEYRVFAPSLLSGAFIKKAIKTCGPIVAVGFMACVAAIIVSRKKEEAQVA